MPLRAIELISVPLETFERWVPLNYFVFLQLHLRSDNLIISQRQEDGNKQSWNWHRTAAQRLTLTSKTFISCITNPSYEDWPECPQYTHTVHWTRAETTSWLIDDSTDTKSFGDNFGHPLLSLKYQTFAAFRCFKMIITQISLGFGLSNQQAI